MITKVFTFVVHFVVFVFLHAAAHPSCAAGSHTLYFEKLYSEAVSAFMAVLRNQSALVFNTLWAFLKTAEKTKKRKLLPASKQWRLLF